MPSSPPELVLCYISTPWAYFTSQPLEKQTGDDWNDAPYEHNAEPPYEWREHNGGEPWRIVKVAFASDLETPADRAEGLNSSWSVDQINAGAIAWLIDPQYGIRPRTFPGVVWAGTTLSEFCRLIRKRRDGEVYFPVGENLAIAHVAA